jgi:hypothetical protein
VRPWDHVVEELRGWARRVQGDGLVGAEAGGAEVTRNLLEDGGNSAQGLWWPMFFALAGGYSACSACVVGDGGWKASIAASIAFVMAGLQAAYFTRGRTWMKYCPSVLTLKYCAQVLLTRMKNCP